MFNNQYRTKSANVALVIPSVYGSVAWIGSLLLYNARLISWNEPDGFSLFFLWLCGLCFLMSACVLYPAYKSAITNIRSRAGIQGLRKPGKPFKRMLLILHFLGAIGLLLYIQAFARDLGGYGRFFSLLINQSYLIRWQAEYTDSVGTQLSYFGWPAMAVTIVLVLKKQLPKRWVTLAAVQFVGNCLFIGRTRPIWLVLTAAITLAPISRPVSVRKAVYMGAWLLIALLGLFLALGLWIGKINDIVLDRSSFLPTSLQNVYLYTTGGYAYLDEIVKNEAIHDYGITRTAYPLFRVLASLGIAPEPPNQINTPASVPYSINVGTALEPFYRDGGIVGLTLGIVIITFGTDLLALWCLQSNQLIGWFAAGNCCFSSAIAFFTPKITSFPIWLFIGLAIIARLSAHRSLFRKFALPIRPEESSVVYRTDSGITATD